jgi:hypothetical protein
MVDEVAQRTEHWTEVVEGLEKAMNAHDVDIENSIKMSTMLEVDVAAEAFVGDNAEAANRFLKRQYRDPFAVPDLS